MRIKNSQLKIYKSADRLKNRERGNKMAMLGWKQISYKYSMFVILWVQYNTTQEII